MGLDLLDHRIAQVSGLYSVKQINMEDVTPQVKSIFLRSSVKQNYLTKSSNLHMMGT